MKLTVGQKLWWVPVNTWTVLHGNEGREVTVIKVGRRWATVTHGASHFRIDFDGLREERANYGLSGRCYLNSTEYKEKLAVDHEWRWLRHMIPGSAPAHITFDAIQLIASVIGIEPRKTA